MDTVASRDGTSIAYWRSGSGPPLVLVHGALADHETAWRDVIDCLASSFTVFAMDRRGRGGSGPAHAHTIEQGYDDIVAVVDDIGGEVDVLGHSYGANLVLGAALRSKQLRRLVLYEPQPKSKPDPEYVDKLDAYIEAGDLEGFFATFFRVPPERAGRLRKSPKWDEWVRFAAATAADRRAFSNYVVQPQDFAQVRVPTLFLRGEKSPDRITSLSDQLATIMPDTTTAELPGQDHFAMNTAPELFCKEVVRFLAG